MSYILECDGIKLAPLKRAWDRSSTWYQGYQTIISTIKQNLPNSIISIIQSGDTGTMLNEAIFDQTIGGNVLTTNIGAVAYS